MNKGYFLLIFFLISISCSDEVNTISRSKQEQLDLDKKRIEGYLNENNLTGFTSLDNGLHYKILDQGNSEFPSIGDTLSVDYIGQLHNGSEFDRNNTNQPFQFILGSGQLIEGWEMGLPYIDESGTGILIIPSGLAYGKSSSGSIPENAVLIFRIKLLEIR